MAEGSKPVFAPRVKPECRAIQFREKTPTAAND